MHEALTRLGHQVTLACSGMEAIKLCRKHRYDLLILDYRMPDMDGLEVAQHFNGNERFILHTSDYDNREIALQAMRLGALGVIAKISDIAGFQSSIGAFLNKLDSRWMGRSLERFPFDQSSGKCSNNNQWLAEDVDYATACAKGREYAANTALYLKANPSLVGSNIISQIASDMAFADDYSAKGYRVGFFSFLEMMIYEFSCDHNVSAYLDRINEVYTAAKMARGQKGKS